MGSEIKSSAGLGNVCNLWPMCRKMVSQKVGDICRRYLGARKKKGKEKREYVKKEMEDKKIKENWIVERQNTRISNMGGGLIKAK